ncbi:metallophosphoesterase [Rathayibacter soli]|uniref:metallophosphoesterase n=1 Tax=Rathayibacter soli TaxID=3144168 RepID=UPI0027E47FD9|nr:metallophosphoesterase [Glaciibacter superstes]
MATGALPPFDFGQIDFDRVDFVTSDTHFGHARINALAHRPFGSADEMDDELIRRWNTVVGPDDVVLHLGDLALGRIEESVAVTGRLAGQKLLVPGNHDRVSTATQTKRAVERFTPLYQRYGWTILPEIVQGTRHGRVLLASHYPYRGDSQEQERHFSKRPIDRGMPLIHGHTHARDHGPDGTQFHVGVDAFDYAPIPFTLIDAWLARVASNRNVGGS